MKSHKATLCGQLSGHFQLVVHGGARGRLVLAEFDNMILDAGLNRFTNSGCISAAQVGTSNAAVSGGQTSLSGYLAGTTGTGTGHGVDTYVAGPPAYHQSVYVYRFATGVAAGNLAEVGVGWSAATGNLFSRALIVDGGGATNPITVLADESLDVVYTLRIYAPADVSSSVTISGTSYSFTIRPAGFSNSTRWAPRAVSGGSFTTSNSWADTFTGAIGAITGTPSGTISASTGTSSPQTYSNNSYFRDILITLGLTQGNVTGGFQSLYFAVGSSLGAAAWPFQIQFSPLVDKNTSKSFSLTVRLAWARRP